MIPRRVLEVAGPRRQAEGNGLVPAGTIANWSTDAGREVAIDQGIVGTRISVDPLTTPAAILGDVGLPKHPLHVLLVKHTLATA